MLAVLSDDEIEIRDSYMHRESIKEIDGRRYDAESKAWYVPLNDKNIALLVTLGANLDDELRMRIKAESKTAEKEEPLLPMRILATPYAHQVKAYNFALRVFGIGGVS